MVPLAEVLSGTTAVTWAVLFLAVVLSFAFFASFVGSTPPPPPSWGWGGGGGANFPRPCENVNIDAVDTATGVMTISWGNGESTSLHKDVFSGVTQATLDGVEVVFHIHKRI
jgi:hypothetical protein